MLIAEARSLIHSRASLLDRGVRERSIAQNIRAGTLMRLDRGFYVPRESWDGAYAEGRHLMRVLAAAGRRRDGDAVFCLTSAAVLHELPLFRAEPDRVHLCGTQVDGRVRRVRTDEPLVARHDMRVDPDDIVEIDGIACTSLVRTVADMARWTPQATALAAADAAFRRVAWNERDHSYDEDAAEAFRDAMLSRLRRGARGVRAARVTAGLADGRAQLPGETVSRLYLLQLGFRRLRLQVAVPGPEGKTYVVDIGIEDVPAWGEFDGETKYRDEAKRRGLSIEEVILAEKRREDWIRGTTNRRFARWGMSHVATAQTLGARLAEFHIFPPGH